MRKFKKEKISLLPVLPKKRNNREARITTTRIKKELLLQYPHGCVAEVKIRGRKILPHQLAFLKQAASDKGVCFKPPDYGMRNPCDLFCFRNAEAVIIWIEKNGKLTFEKVDNFLA